MRKILTPPPYPLMNTIERLLALRVFGPVLGSHRRILQSLDARQVFLVAPHKARILDLLAVRSGQERGETHIHPDDLLDRAQPPGCDFNREGDIPFATSRLLQADRLDLAFDGPVPNNLDAPDLRDDQIGSVEPDAAMCANLG